MDAFHNHEDKTESVTLNDYREMCDTFERLRVQVPQEIPPFFAREQYDSGFEDELSEPIFSHKENIPVPVYNKLTINDPTQSFTTEDTDTDMFFCRDEDGDTLLHISILHGDECIVFQIIQMAPDLTLSIANNLRQTALHLAVLTRQSRVVRRLISAGASVDAQDNSGNTPLHLACALGYCDIVQQLLKPIEYEETLVNKYRIPYQRIPQNMNVRNFEGYSCLHLAIVNNHSTVIPLLLDAGVDIKFGHGKSGRSALHMASENGNIEILLLLVAREGVNIDIQDFGGLTPFQLAHGRQFDDVVRFLLQKGAMHDTLD